MSLFYSFSSSPSSVGPLGGFQNIIPSPFGFSRIDLISDEGLRQYWEELEQRVGLSFHLKDLIHKIDDQRPSQCYLDRFCLLSHALQKNGVPFPVGIIAVAPAHFRWVESQISELDHSLFQIWDAIESQIPFDRRAKFSLLSTPSEKASKIRQWLQDEQFAEERHQIKHLLLSNTGLKIIPPEIGYLTGLRTLALDGNQIEKLPPEIGNLKELQDLILNDNKIEEIPFNIGNLVNLKQLRLDNNQIKLFPEPILNLMRLEILLLDNNPLSELPVAIARLGNLYSLGLRQTPIRELPPSIKQMQSLEILDFGLMGLSKFPEELIELKKLSFLNLEGNQLTCIPPSIGNCKSIQKLYLNNNRISYLPREVGELDQLKVFNVDENPLFLADPRLLDSPIEALQELLILQNLRMQFHYSCITPFGRLYQAALAQESPDELKKLIKELPLCFQKELSLKQEQICGISSQLEPLVQNPLSLTLLLQNIIVEKFEALPLAQKQQVVADMKEEEERFIQVFGGNITKKLHLVLVADRIELHSGVELEVFKQMSIDQKNDFLNEKSVLQQILLLQECLDKDAEIPERFEDVITGGLYTDPVRDHCGGEAKGHLFERGAIIRSCSKSSVKLSEIEEEKNNPSPAVCPLSRQPLGVERKLVHISSYPDENWIYDFYYRVQTLSPEEGKGLVPDRELQLEILNWLKVQMKLIDPSPVEAGVDLEREFVIIDDSKEPQSDGDF